MNIDTLSRRQFLRITAGVAASGVLAACAMPTAPASDGAEAAIEIGFARHGNETSQATEDVLARLFEEANPGIVIDPIAVPWSDYNTKIPIDIAGGTPPDTFTCHPALMINT